MPNWSPKCKVSGIRRVLLEQLVEGGVTESVWEVTLERGDNFVATFCLADKPLYSVGDEVKYCVEGVSDV